MSENFHMCQSVEGPLRNWKKSDWKRGAKYIFKGDGSSYTADELKDAFFEELAKGHRVIPIGECDNFSWTDGCQGHSSAPKPESKPA